MGNPFQDQFLKAGLVNKKQVKKAKHEKRQNKAQPAQAQQPSAEKKKREQEKERVRQLNQQRQAEQQQQESQSQIEELIKKHRLQRDEQGETYNFVDGNKIKRIYVSAEMAQQLSTGQLAIVSLGKGYEIVAAKVGQQIAKRNKAALITWHRPDNKEKL